MLQADVDEHAIEPRRKSGAATELIRGAVEPDERFLAGVARLFGVAQDVPGQPPGPLLVARDQEIEGGFLTAGHALTQHLIGRLHSPSLLRLLLILDISSELSPILAPVVTIVPKILAIGVQVLPVGPEVLACVLDLFLVAALDRVLELLPVL